jgi:hypothetical protein
MTPTEPIRWTVHPIRENRKVAVVAILLTCCLTLGVHLKYQDLFLTCLTPALFLGGLRAYFFPMWFTVNKDGVTRRDILTSTMLPWDRVQEIRELVQGIQLLGPRRPMLLPCRGEQRTRVAEFIRELHIDAGVFEEIEEREQDTP